MAQHKPGFMEKIKDKLPGHHHMPDVSGEETEETVPRRPVETDSAETPARATVPPGEKKSMVQKIKEKFSGNHSKENSGGANNNVSDTPVPKDNNNPGVKDLSVDDDIPGGYNQKKAGKVVRPGMARNNSF